MLLKDYVPSLLCSGEIFSRIYAAQQTKIDSTNMDIQDLINQCFIETATWGLVLWEEEFGVKTDLTDTYENRRSRVIAKKRGQGVTTVAMIKNVAEAFANGTVEVIEDNIEYNFAIKFVSTKGIPPKIEDLKSAIDQIKPAHLGVSYLFTYLIWSEFDNYNKTWNMWDALNLDWDNFEVYMEV